MNILSYKENPTENISNKKKTVCIYLAGSGLVGSALINQLKNQHSYNANIMLKGIINSRKMLLSDKNLLENYSNDWEQKAQHACIEQLFSNIFNSAGANNVFVDCTANADIANHYPRLLEKGVNIVAANKIAASADYASYKKLIDLAREHDCCFRYETNVGAGLPLLGTINDMVKSGDKVTGIQAVLSGSLNFILNKVKSGISLADAIRKARKAGFTEPDPRIDLSGKDVKRKLLILLRVAGYVIEDEDIAENAFVPATLLKIESMDEFYKEIEKFGIELEEKIAKLSEDNKCLRYMAALKNGQAQIGLEEIGSEHSFYQLDDSNNIVAIYSTRYKEHPLTIRGYGAGAEVTAAGVFADIMKIALS